MMLMALSWWLGFHVRVEATAVANIAAAIQRHVKTFFSKFWCLISLQSNEKDCAMLRVRIDEIGRVAQI